MDLCFTYECPESDLRMFLDAHGIRIDIEECHLWYRNKDYNIKFNRYGSTPFIGSNEYNAWSVGSKFYYDYTIRGFLSINHAFPYGGYVHLVPEIISDIDRLIGKDLKIDWMHSTRAYEIVAIVDGNDFVVDAEGTDGEKMVAYILKAYEAAWGYEFENIILLNDGVKISAHDILEINEFNAWYGKE